MSNEKQNEKQYIVDKPLEQWIQQDKFESEFPEYGSVNYPLCYQMMADYMNKNIHTEVTIGAIIQQIKSANANLSFNEILYLNDHGPNHVKMVIAKATELLKKSKAYITPYEAYILLVAIHFHDVGIWLGRNGHEKKIAKIMRHAEVNKHLPCDTTVLRVIKLIAQAHGGHYEGNKDTIYTLKKSDVFNNFEIRKQFLAALLRISDELADDNTRAKPFAVNATDNNVPQHCMIFHEYSSCLHSVIFDGTDIRLAYSITVDKARKVYSKPYRDNNGNISTTQTYLLDEIYTRTLKMHMEKTYCMRFLSKGGISIEKIRVTIEIINDSYDKCIDSIFYDLQEKGYPGQIKNISDICPDLEEKNGKWLVTQLGNIQRNP